MLMRASEDRKTEIRFVDTDPFFQGALFSYRFFEWGFQVSCSFFLHTTHVNSLHACVNHCIHPFACLHLQLNYDYMCLAACPYMCVL